MLYDIYGLSLGRDEATIEGFLRHFCDRYSIEPLVDNWLQVRANEKYQIPEVELPLHSIAELIEYGINNPTHQFNFYNQTALRPDIHTVFLNFTYDSKVVFGISIYETTDYGEDNFPRACAIEEEIIHVTHSYKSFIAVEYPPADDEKEFDADILVWQNMRDEYSK
ncbi:MAG: hypothetical protein EOO37_03510 [Cytophagaceae bacterium]|nr:MAG: hypothetical protein EOO37_03510 [Cytophagaceae bacterium]